jgi:hypothetical protein
MNPQNYINPIPSKYIPPLGLPLHWRNEQSGRLKAAILAFWNYRVNSCTPPNEEQIFLIKCYLEHFIMAPCWQHDSDGILISLRSTVTDLNDLDRIYEWLKVAMKIALDPL